MKRILRLLVGLVLAFVQIGVFAQSDNPRIAVIPFNHINLSEADASVLTGLFETALVKTEVYGVIEQSQIKEILAAQEYSISDCTDDECAVEFGRLLAAERIVLGTLSSLGGKIILNAKIIDVATGENIKADKETTDTLAEMADAVELLAFKLAGLTFIQGTQQMIAREFGEVFIETDPSEADIFINGVRKGVSPNLISRVPIGRIVVECRKENLYGRQEVEVTTATKKITVSLSLTYGNLFIQSTESEVEVFLDGASLGELGSGFFEEIPVGDHTVVLEGEGLYWEGEVTVETEESARLEAYPREFGSIQYQLPEGALGEVTGRMFRETIRGTGSLQPVWVGEYTIQVTAENYEPLEQKVAIQRGQSLRFAPELEFTEEYRRYIEESEKGKLFAAFEERLAGLEGIIEPGHRVTQEEIDRAAALAQEISEAKYDFPVLLDRSRRISQEAARRKPLQDRLEELALLCGEKARKVERMGRRGAGSPVLKWSALGGGLASAALSGLTYFLGHKAYNNYLAADNLEDLETYKRRFKTWDLLTVTCWGGGAAGGIAFGVLTLLKTDPRKLEGAQKELAEIDAEIRSVEEDLQ